MSATAAAEAGCAALLPSAGPGRPDPWIAAAVLSEALPELALTIALQAGAILPGAAALCAQSLQSLRGGRLALAVERDAPGVDASRRGATLNRDQRRARRLEFLAILPTLWAGTGPLDYQGAWFRAEHARLAEMPVPRRPLYWMAAAPADNLRVAPLCDGLIAAARPDPAVFEALARVSAARALHCLRRASCSAAPSAWPTLRARPLAWAPPDELLHGVSVGIYMKAHRALDAYYSVAQRSQAALSAARAALAARTGGLSEPVGRCRPHARERGHSHGRQTRPGRAAPG
ncbi:luciferase-like monooxygenase family protein [Burkholderia gladioli]|uniref:Luciferase-like monooxygenase family protein n=1 Tax=Burkholderia gladioli TaxID=28095 RepID=A0AAW3F9K3_BURGA|nr:LLM class flavin-dependent oxidoreductase [Burkholderia gladioli]KGC19966.1 luciferase-like monooxygenase family protein [Burkholderia gladioli]